MPEAHGHTFNSIYQIFFFELLSTTCSMYFVSFTLFISAERSDSLVTNSQAQNI